MKEKIFVSTTFVKDGTPISEVLEICEKAKINNLELGSNHCWQINQRKTVCNFKSNNYLVHNYFPVPKNNFVVNIASNNNNIRKRSILHAKNCINFAKTINAKLYTLHFGFLADPVTSNISNKNYDFVFNEEDKNNVYYDKTFNNMINSLIEIIKYAKLKRVNIALETEGSAKKDYCFMSRAWEYEKLFKIFSKNELKLNLNLGHLFLEYSNKKDINKFLNIVKKRVVALEISHNDGKLDQHLPILNKAWYWNIINDKYFANCFKILEFRNTKIKDIHRCLSYFE